MFIRFMSAFNSLLRLLAINFLLYANVYHLLIDNHDPNLKSVTQMVHGNNILCSRSCLVRKKKQVIKQLNNMV